MSNTNTVTRLSVRFESRHALVSAYTTAIVKGVVVIPTRRPLVEGDAIVLVMTAVGVVDPPVEVYTEVLRVDRNLEGVGQLVGLRYVVTEEGSRAISVMVGGLSELQRFETKRRCVRVPVNLPGELTPLGIGLQVLDISLGGLRLALPFSLSHPKELKRKARLFIALSDTTSSIDGEVVWTRTLPTGPLMGMPLVGVRFRNVPRETEDYLAQLLSLTDFLPGPPPVLVRVIG